MGYQDGMGLRPGRTTNKAASSRGMSDASAFNSASGYRAAGAVSPIRSAEPVAEPTGSAALAQFGAMPVPKAPSLAQTVIGSVGSNIAGKAIEKGFDYASNAMGLASGISNSALSAANSSADPIGALADSQGWFAGASGSGPVDVLMAEPGSSAGSFSSFMDTPLWDAGPSIGGAVPYIPAVGKLVSGDVGGAAKSAAGTYAGQAIGNMILPGIGGVIGGAIGSACFITEATMAGLGIQDDNAEPLKVLRFFRDKVLAGTPQGQAMIQEYEAIAPLVVQAVESRPDAMEIFKGLYDQFIAPSVEAVKAGDYPQALQIYAAMIAAVTPLAQQAMDDDDAMYDAGEGEAMEMMGQDARMVAQNPQVAQQAAPSQGNRSALQQFNADDYPTSVRFGRQ